MAKSEGDGQGSNSLDSVTVELPLEKTWPLTHTPGPKQWCPTWACPLTLSLLHKLLYIPGQSRDHPADDIAITGNYHRQYSGQFLGNSPSSCSFTRTVTNSSTHLKLMNSVRTLELIRESFVALRQLGTFQTNHNRFLWFNKVIIPS